MIFKQLTQYLNVYEPVKKRGSGISIKDLRYLEELGIVQLVKLPLKSGKQPKNHNAFELTLFGRDIIRQYSSGRISKQEILAKIHDDMSEVKTQIDAMQQMLDDLENQLSSMENFLTQYASDTREAEQQITELTDNEILELLHQAEESATRDDKMGLLFKTEIYYDIIAQHSPLSDSSINQVLYKLYEKNQLDLQMGPDHGGRPVKSPSRKLFSWGNVVS